MTPKVVTVTINDFSAGSNYLVDEARMPSKFAVQANNLMQVQNGLWQTRWGTQAYGADLGASPDGACEYVKTDGTTELVAVVGGVVKKSTNGGTWSSVSGATLTSGLQCYFMQMGGYDTSNVYHAFLYIANGTDPLTRYDGSSLTQYASLAAPANLTASLVASGLSSGVNTYYGQVTALNQVGETVGSTEASITTNKLRDSWDVTKDKITWSWNAVSGATQYQLYISDTQGYEALLTSLTATSFTDDGSLVINPYVEIPYDNTTTAPKFISMCTSNNRIWATNDTADMYKVYFSGTGRNIGAFSDFFGGGWINLERGGKEIPIAVKHYQTGTGQGVATVLCKTSNGQGAVWQINIISATVGSSTFSIPSASKVVGSFGAESLLGVVQGTNNLCFPNRKGWFSLGSQQNYYGILRTNELSSNIRPYWRSFVGSQVKGICAYFYDAKIFISVPTGSAGNDRMIVFNEELGNWSVDWSIGAKQYLEYTDTSGNTHLLYIPTSGTKLIELSESYLNDEGAAFNQSYTSPLLPVSSDKSNIMSHISSIVELGRPQGAITFQLLGVSKDSNFSTVASRTITNFGSNTGRGTNARGAIHMTSTSDNTKRDALDILFESGLESNSLSKEGFSRIDGSISSAVANTGTYSLKIQASQFPEFLAADVNGVTLSQDHYYRLYIYITSFPASRRNLFLLPSGSSVAIDTSHRLLLTNDVGDIGSPSTALSLNTWYAIEVKETLTDNDSYTGTTEFRINGVTIASSSNINFAGDLRTVTVGDNDATAITYYVDNIAVGTGGWIGTKAVVDSNNFPTNEWTVYYISTPKTFTQALTKKAIKKKAKLYAVQFKVYSTTASTKFTINAIQSKGNLIQRRIPSQWVTG